MITKIGIGVLVGIGLFMILADCFRIPYMRTSKAVNNLASNRKRKQAVLMFGFPLLLLLLPVN